MNRLNLDYSINSAKDREKYTEEYLQNEMFKKKPPTRRELETIANYILWGKDEDGTSSVQKGDFDIETKSKTWDKKEAESLDGLMETPTFSELQIQRNSVPTKIVKEVFSREETRKEIEGTLLETFEGLWREIDILDLEICFYEERTGKRKNPPRNELLKRFAAEDIKRIYDSAANLTQHQYLKKRHLLVELRREQYTLRDGYRPGTLPAAFTPFSEKDDRVFWGENTPVFPVGVIQKGEAWEKLFGKEFPYPNLFREKEIGEIMSVFHDLAAHRSDRVFFDFGNEEHVYQLIGIYEDLEEAGSREDYWGLTKRFLKTFDWYKEMANLTEPQKMILEKKIHKVRNQDIAAEVNRTFGKSYTTNYISTIFKKNIIKSICEAANYHRDIIENLEKPKNFKVCNSCGRTLLNCERNFMKKAKSVDGFVNKCKNCDKEKRSRG